MKLLNGILLAGALLLAACNPSSDSGKAPLEQQRNALEKAKKVDGVQQQEAQKQQQEADKQAQ